MFKLSPGIILCLLLRFLTQTEGLANEVDGDHKPNLVRPQPAVATLFTNDLKNKHGIRHGAGFFCFVRWIGSYCPACRVGLFSPQRNDQRWARIFYSRRGRRRPGA